MAAWRKEEVDAARHRQEKREATRLGKLLSHTEAENIAKRHQLASSTSRESLYGRETCVAPRHVHASLDFFVLFFFRTSSGGGVGCGGGALSDFLFCSLFPVK